LLLVDDFVTDAFGTAEHEVVGGLNPDPLLAGDPDRVRRFEHMTRTGIAVQLRGHRQAHPFAAPRDFVLVRAHPFDRPAGHSRVWRNLCDSQESDDELREFHSHLTNGVKAWFSLFSSPGRKK